MFGSAAETEAVVAGFLAALGERTRAPAAASDRTLPARVMALACDIAARHRTRLAGAQTAQDLRAAAVVLAAYRLLAGALPAPELRALLHDCWLAGLGCCLPAGDLDWADPSADPLGEAGAGSRWRELAAMLFCMAGLPGLYARLEARLTPGARFAAEREFWRDFCAAEAVPELVPVFGGVVGPDGGRGAGDGRRPLFWPGGA